MIQCHFGTAFALHAESVYCFSMAPSSYSPLSTAAVVFGIASLLLLPACWVSSINGLDEAGLFGSDKDRTFDPNLMGFWGMTGEDCSITLSIIAAHNQTYNWQTTSVGSGCNNEKGSEDHYEAALFQLGDHQFLDLTARPEDVCSVCIAVHWIFLIQRTRDSFSLVPIDSDWLKAAQENKAVTLATLSGRTDVITATPKELKAFCRKYAGDTGVFKPVPELIFKRKQ